MSRPLAECGLCENVSQDVETLLAEWVSPLDARQPWDSILRCRDSAACRARVEQAGGRWPVVDPGPLQRGRYEPMQQAPPAPAREEPPDTLTRAPEAPQEVNDVDWF